MRLHVDTVDMGAIYGSPVEPGLDEYEDVTSCPVCGSSDRQTTLSTAVGATGVGLAVAHCASCSHGYLARRPSTRWFGDYYAEEWDAGRGRPPFTVRTKDWLKRREAVFRTWSALRALKGVAPIDTWEARLLSMSSGIGAGEAGPYSLAKGGSVLEIGAGYGHALAAFGRAGMRAVGTEASRHRVEACRQRGLDVRLTGIDDLDAVSSLGPFDLVFSAQVFEHLPDLGAVMSRISPLVRPGGAVHLEVPHAAVIENLVHRTHVPAHLHLFSPRSLVTLLERAGFRLRRVLADTNIHVVAVKADHVDFPDVPVSLDPHVLRRGLDQLAPGRRSDYGYDHFAADVVDAASGHLEWERPATFPSIRITRPGSDRLLNTFTVTRLEGDDQPWPVVFEHDGARPPVWLKHQ